MDRLNSRVTLIYGTKKKSDKKNRGNIESEGQN